MRGLLKRRKVAVFEGTGRLEPDRTVVVEANGPDGGDTETLRADHVLLAAGSVPITLPGFDRDPTLVMTSDEVLALDEVPGRVAVIGGGAIGCEFASMLCDLGAEVTVLEYAPQIVPGVDADISKALGRAFSKRGITVRTGCRVTGHTPTDGGGTTVNYTDAKSADEAPDAQIEVDAVVVSVGRRPFCGPSRARRHRGGGG